VQLDLICEDPSERAGAHEMRGEGWSGRLRLKVEYISKQPRTISIQLVSLPEVIRSHASLTIWRALIVDSDGTLLCPPLLRRNPVPWKSANGEIRAGNAKKEGKDPRGLLKLHSEPDLVIYWGLFNG
jgi:hypothetical protein